MRRLPAPVLPPPPPNTPTTPCDSPKLGDDRLPIGVERFTWFSIFWKLMETLRLYLFSLGATALAPCGPAPIAATLGPPPPPAAGPPGPPPGPLGPDAPPAGAALLPLLILP